MDGLVCTFSNEAQGLRSQRSGGRTMAMAGALQLSDFHGTWRLTRQIEDLARGVPGILQGEARFEVAGPELLQTETGVLRYGDAPPMAAKRVYRWRRSEDRIEVCFEDGRPFHAFVPDTEPVAQHFCSPDTYTVRYQFGTWPVWSSAWRVTGPRKDLIILSRFERAGA